jgi:hypothetical protein
MDSHHPEERQRSELNQEDLTLAMHHLRVTPTESLHLEPDQ